jgi:hypothetical protein
MGCTLLGHHQELAVTTAVVMHFNGSGVTRQPQRAYYRPTLVSRGRSFLGPAVLNRMHLRSRQLELIYIKIIGHVLGIRRASKGNHF